MRDPPPVSKGIFSCRAAFLAWTWSHLFVSSSNLIATVSFFICLVSLFVLSRFFVRSVAYPGTLFVMSRFPVCFLACLVSFWCETTNVSFEVFWLFCRSIHILGNMSGTIARLLVWHWEQMIGDWWCGGWCQLHNWLVTCKRVLRFTHANGSTHRFLFLVVFCVVITDRWLLMITCWTLVVYRSILVVVFLLYYFQSNLHNL